MMDSHTITMSHSITFHYQVWGSTIRHINRIAESLPLNMREMCEVFVPKSEFVPLFIKLLNYFPIKIDPLKENVSKILGWES